MITVLSPSKSVTDRQAPSTISPTPILFPAMTSSLIQQLKTHSAQELAAVLQVSPKLAELNYKRFQAWDKTKTTPAIWLYSGDVYAGFDSFTLSDDAVRYAQEHVVIVSGLYGIVRPLDGIQPYRLEMKLPYSGPWGNTLYAAWQETLADYIAASGHTEIVLCTSKEYSKAITTKLNADIQVLTPRFMQNTPSGLREKGLFAKYCRGRMARWIVDNRVENKDQLLEYSLDGLHYSPEHSTANELVYILPDDFSLVGKLTKL